MNPSSGCCAPDSIKVNWSSAPWDKAAGPWDGMHMNVELTEDEMRRKVRDLQTKVEDLTELVNALLSVITEEPDGVSSGAAPVHGSQGHAPLCM